MSQRPGHRDSMHGKVSPEAIKPSWLCLPICDRAPTWGPHFGPAEKHCSERHVSRDRSQKHHMIFLTTYIIVQSSTVLIPEFHHGIKKCHFCNKDSKKCHFCNKSLYMGNGSSCTDSIKILTPNMD